MKNAQKAVSARADDQGNHVEYIGENYGEQSRLRRAARASEPREPQAQAPAPAPAAPDEAVEAMGRARQVREQAEQQRKRRPRPTLDDLPPEWRKQLALDRGGDFVFRSDRSVVAFTARQNRLITESNDPRMVELLVRVAEERGWEQLRARGTEQFRREVWLAATARGLRVAGYAPDEGDRLELRERTRNLDREQKAAADERALRNLDPATMGWREPAHRNAAATLALVDKALEQKKVDSPETARAVQSGIRARLAERGTENLRVVRLRDHGGRLLEHGRARYGFDPEAKWSYFAKVERDGATRTIWGVGLEDAIRKSNAQIGDRVEFRVETSQPVTVQERQRTAGGLGPPAQIHAHRNGWVAQVTSRSQELGRAPDQQSREERQQSLRRSR